MALIDQPIPNLIGGVSQQAPISRYSNQLEAQVNCLADPVEGLIKRPPSEVVAKLVDDASGTLPALFKIDRDPDNRFIGAVFPNGSVRVFDVFTGEEKTVTNNCETYLTSTDPRDSIRTLTVADYTYIANRSVQIAAKPDTKELRPYEGLVFVRAGNYGKDYTLTIEFENGTTVTGTINTPRGDDPSHVEQIDTVTIASQLKAAIETNPQAPEVVRQNGSVLYIYDSTRDFKLSAEDGQGKQALKAFKEHVQRFSDLPQDAEEGITLRVAGDQTSAFDDYYVRFHDGVWEETLKPGLQTSLDETTMPVALIRNPDNTFTVDTLPWVDRKVCDDESTPFPSFLGFGVRSMFYFRNRLGFLADENVILSQAGDYFNFFRTTATQVLPGDPIDVTASDASGESSPVSLLEHAVAFDKKLVLFARNAQFILDSNGLLTPGETQVDPVTSFACSPDCRPVTAGRYVYFVFDRDGASGLREFYVDGAAQTEDAIEVTSHVPTYLPPGIVSMASSTLENVLLCISDQTPQRIYVYEYFFGGTEKLQSAFGYWEFSQDNEVIYCDFFENIAYVVFRRAGGLYLERIRMRPGLVDTDLPYFTLLDHRVHSDDLAKVYNPITQETVVTLPYPSPENVQAVTVKSSSGLHSPGTNIEVLRTPGDTIVLSGDKRQWSFVVGVPYNKQAELTRPVVSQPAQNGTVANTEAIVKVRDFSVDFAGTGYFEAIFTPKFRTPVKQVFSGTILGVSPTDEAEMDEGTFRISTPTRNTYWSLRIENPSPFPSRILAASWRGLVESRSRRV